MTAQTILPANTLSGGYDVDNSLRFNSGSSDSLTLSTTAGNRTTWTFSTWFKRSKLGVLQSILEHDDTNYFRVRITSGDVLEVFDSNGNNTWSWHPLLRDISAWYHIVIRGDSTDGTNGNRLRLYINGTLASANAVASISQNYTFSFNQGGTLQIGKRGSTDYLDGYLAETILIDGSALAPDQFGEFDSATAIWKPIDVSGLTFGNQGLYLEFKGSGTSANSSGLGADTSGNDHHFTVNNLTAGDQSTDTCTNNFCTLSPLYNVDGSYTLSEGNTQFLGTGGNDHTLGTLGVQGSGKWYFEAEFDTRSQGAYSGFADSDLANNLASDAAGVTVFIGMYRDDHTMQIGGGNEGAYTDVSDGDIFGFAMNLDANSGSRTVIVQKNGSTIDTVTIPTANEDNIFIPIAGDTSGTDSTLKMNFGGTPNPTPSSGVADANGHGSFEYNPTISSVNYLAICTKNIAEFG